MYSYFFTLLGFYKSSLNLGTNLSNYAHESPRYIQYSYNVSLLLLPYIHSLSCTCYRQPCTVAHLLVPTTITTPDHSFITNRLNYCCSLTSTTISFI